MSLQTIPLGIYKHYKGHEYQVIGFALHTETHETLVLYKPLYTNAQLEEECGKDPTFARPINMFTEMVLVTGKRVPRFIYIS